MGSFYYEQSISGTELPVRLLRFWPYQFLSRELVKIVISGNGHSASQGLPYLRGTMLQGRLMVLHVHKQCTDSLDLKEANDWL